MNLFLLLFVATLFLLLFIFVWLWYCERDLRKNHEEAVDVLSKAVDAEYAESRRFHEQRDEARFAKAESDKMYAAILKEWTDAKRRFSETLEASEKDRLNARAESQDLRTERDFHHSAQEAAEQDRDEMQKKLQQKELELQATAASRDAVQLKYDDLVAKVDAFKSETTYKSNFLGDYTKGLS